MEIADSKSSRPDNKSFMPVSTSINEPISKGKTKLSHKVFDYVVNKIRSGGLTPSTRITERQLASELEISHVPVREAMEVLHQHGWIERIPNKGSYVRELTHSDIEETYLVREIIETDTVRQVAPRITAEQLKTLKGIVDKLEWAYDNNKAEEFKDADIQFHRSLVHFSGSSRLDNIFQSIVLQARCFFFIGASETSICTSKAREYLQPVSHTRIYESLESHDVDLAEELVRQHIKVGLVMITELRDLLSLK